MNILLYRVGRNLNRAYRTAEAFGVDKMLLLDCNQSYIGGNLFKAAGRVEIKTSNEFPPSLGILALETFYERSIYNVDWSMVTTIVIGGETGGLPRTLEAEQRVHIPMAGHVSGLTVEAALAIALYEWRRNDTPARTRRI